MSSTKRGTIAVCAGRLPTASVTPYTRALYTYVLTSYPTPTLTMGIPVLLNPFGAERSTRQRLLNAIQQTGDYTMSQHVLMTASTLATKTLLCPNAVN